MLLSKNKNKQILNVAVVGNNNCGKSKLINYWTETNLTDSVNGQKSMIVEIDSEFVDLNIYKISSTTLLTQKNIHAVNKKIFHAIIYVYDLHSESTKNGIPDWITYFKNKIKHGTYQIILGMGKDDVLTETDEINTIREYYDDFNIDYHRSSFSLNEHLSNLLNVVSIKSFICMKQRSKTIKQKIDPEYIYIGCCIIL